MTLLDKANQVAGGIFFNIINNYPKPVFKLKKKKCYRPDKIFWSPDCDTLPTVFIHSFVGGFSGYASNLCQSSIFT